MALLKSAISSSGCALAGLEGDAADAAEVGPGFGFWKNAVVTPDARALASAFCSYARLFWPSAAAATAVSVLTFGPIDPLLALDTPLALLIVPRAALVGVAADVGYPNVPAPLPLPLPSDVASADGAWNVMADECSADAEGGVPLSGDDASITGGDPYTV